MPKAANYHPESKIFVHTLYIFFFDSFFYIQYFYFDILTSELDFNSISRLYLYRCLGSLSLTRTLPASHASFATVRRLIRRDTFKYLSNLIFCSCKCSVMDTHELLLLSIKKGELSFPGYRLYYLPLTISFNAFPALNFGDLEASIFIVSPV